MLGILFMVVVYLNIKINFQNDKQCSSAASSTRKHSLFNLFKSDLFKTQESPQNYSLPQKIIENLPKSPDDILIRTTYAANEFVCPLARCPQNSAIRIVETTWQLQDHPRGKIYIYSAYYDDRPLASLIPTVKVIAMATVYESMSAYCHIWYDSVETPHVVKAIINKTGLNDYAEKSKKWQEFIYTCPLKSARPVPSHISLTTEQCDPYTTYMKVGYEHHEKPLFNFGICVANGHGPFKATEMIEWFELNMLLGVSEFNLYDTMYMNLTDVFNHYTEAGVMKKFSLVHPLNMTEAWYKKVRNLRGISINDCMLRNMYRYKYLVVIDHDETIIPKNSNNLLDMLQEADNLFNLTYQLYSYSFYNEYFFREFPEDNKKPEYLKTLRLRNRASPNNRYIGSKSIVSPLFCFHLFNHYCYVRLPLYKGVVTKFVPSEMAASHHYRKCGNFIGTGSCETLYNQKTPDDVMLKFESNLTARMIPVLKKLGIFTR